MNNRFASQPKNNRRVTNKARYILMSSMLLFVLSLLLQLYVTNDLAVKGSEMVALQTKKNTLSKEVSELALAQSKYSSLKYIESQALSLGFVKNDAYVSALAPGAQTAALTSH